MDGRELTDSIMMQEFIDVFPDGSVHRHGPVAIAVGGVIAKANAVDASDASIDAPAG